MGWQAKAGWPAFGPPLWRVGNSNLARPLLGGLVGWPDGPDQL